MMPNNLLDNIIGKLREKFDFLLSEQSWRESPESIRLVAAALRGLTIAETRRVLYEQVTEEQNNIEDQLRRIEDIVREHDATAPYLDLPGERFLNQFNTIEQLETRLQLNERNTQAHRVMERIAAGGGAAGALGALEGRFNFFDWLTGKATAAIAFILSQTWNFWNERNHRPEELNNIIQRIRDELRGTTFRRIREENQLLQLIREALVIIRNAEEIQTIPTYQAPQHAQQLNNNEDARVVQMVNALLPSFIGGPSQNNQNNTGSNTFVRDGNIVRFKRGGGRGNHN